MKKIMMIAAMMVAVLSANAQEAGQMFVKPMVGGTLSKLTGDVENVKFKLGLVGGAEFGYHVSNQFALTAGLLVAMEGSGNKDTQYSKDMSTTLTYMNVPVLANFYIAPGLAIKAGVQPGFLLSAKSKGSTDEGGHWEDYDVSGTENLNKFDLSIPMGISYEFGDFVIDARYNLGLLNIAKTEKDREYHSENVSITVHSHDVKVKNSYIMLTLGYKINL
jgi:hypothetical protein